MKVLALDFDGVIADTRIECIFTGFNSYLSLKGASRLFNGEQLTFGNFLAMLNTNLKTVARFNELRSFLKSASDNYPAFYMIEHSLYPKTQDEFDSFARRIIDESGFDRARFQKSMHETRQMLQDEDFGKWSSLVRPFPIVNQKHSLNNRFHLVVSTTNKKELIDRLLEKFYFVPETILDGYYSTDKLEHMTFIKGHYKVPYSDIYFVDDQPSHFPQMLRLGVRCFLADWGYNTPEQRDYAKGIGAGVLSLNNFYKSILD